MVDRPLQPGGSIHEQLSSGFRNLRRLLRPSGARAACLEAAPLLLLLNAIREPAGRDDRDNIDALAASVREGGRVAVARAITLIESRKPEHRAQAQRLHAPQRRGGALAPDRHRGHSGP